MATRKTTRRVTIDNNTRDLIKYGAVLALGYFGIVNPLLKTLHIKDSDKDRADNKAAEQANKANGWNPNYWSSIKVDGKKLLSTSSADALAKRIYDAWGWNDDEEAIYAAFRLLKSQAQLSQLAASYNRQFNQDLLARLQNPWYYLKDGLDANEFAIVARIVNALPNT